MKNATGFYGLQNADTHLMKNSEWGAVVYLTWSEYGRNGTEPNINNVNLNNISNNIYAVTGMYAAGVDTAHTNGSFTGNAYNTSEGQLGSSTGNITGVYDLNGCVWERVAGYIANNHANLEDYGASLLIGDAKYRMIYSHNSGSDSNSNNYLENRVATRYGDAILETSLYGATIISWNGNYAGFPGSNYAFFMYGGCYNERNPGWHLHVQPLVWWSGHQLRVPCGALSVLYNPVPCPLL